MLQKAQERDIIAQIRQHVDTADELDEFIKTTTNFKPISHVEDQPPKPIRLASVQRFMPAYELHYVLQHRLGYQRFLQDLVTFTRMNIQSPTWTVDEATMRGLRVFLYSII